MKLNCSKVKDIGEYLRFIENFPLVLCRINLCIIRVVPFYKTKQHKTKQKHNIRDNRRGDEDWTIVMHRQHWAQDT